MPAMMPERLANTDPFTQITEIIGLDGSHALLASAYPPDTGSLLPLISEDFNRQAHVIANRRIVDAGYRLGWLLEADIGARVSRETQ